MDTIIDLTPKIGALTSLTNLLVEQMARRPDKSKVDSVKKEMELWFPLLDITDAFAANAELRTAAVQRGLDMKMADRALASIRTHMTFFAAAAEGGTLSDKEYDLYARYSMRVLGAFKGALAQLNRNLPRRQTVTFFDELCHAFSVFFGAVAIIVRTP